MRANGAPAHGVALLTFPLSPKGLRSATDMTITIALTGSIGSGKSEVASLFQRWGAAIVDSDVLAREVVKPGSLGLRRVIQHFGDKFLLADGTLDRKRLGNHIFNNPSQRLTLEGILHPLIQERSQQEISQACKAGVKLVVCVIPLLFESGRDLSQFSAIVLVRAPEELLIQRVMARDGISKELALAKLSAQMPQEQKATRATHIIDNAGSPADLERASRPIFDSLVAQAAR
ncbi:MAG: dephospho-CoA kinase [Oligoflexia bacterium]|nr:dephospho-CoA kinase [Oligoflexia bacterium]